MNRKKIALLLFIALLITLFFVFDGPQHLTLTNLKLQQEQLQSFYAENTFGTLAVFFVIYVLVTALSLPGAIIMTLAAGALFGFVTGTIFVSFASSIGATLAFLSARLVFRDSVESRFPQQLQAINKGLQQEGAFYLFTLRLIPLFPFFLINLVMGLTQMKARTFYWVSQLGMLAGTMVFVNAGTQLAAVETPGDILSPAMLISFALLGIFPLLAKRAIGFYKARRIYAPYSKPESFDANTIVIGAGSGGLVSAYIAAAVNARVVLIEKQKMGGDCLNTGCVPSKALIRHASVAQQIREAKQFAIDADINSIDFQAVMERVHKVIQKIEPHDSVERYSKLGVDCVQGSATVLDPWRVEVNDKVLSAKSIILASGARPFVPPIEGLQDGHYLTSDTLWNLKTKPNKLLVLGGGPIGCELAQAFARLGVNVSLVELMPALLGREDREVSARVQQRFVEEGIAVHLNSKAVRAEKNGSSRQLICVSDGEEVAIKYDALLIALGRKANVEGMGLEKLDIKLRDNQTVETNDFLQTNYPNIYAVGDVTGPYQFTHAASHQAWYATVNALFGVFRKFKADYSVIPFATFVDPEVARVGLNETEAKDKGIRYEVSHYGLDDLDRAIADGTDDGFIKVLTVPGKDRILGVTIVGHHAAELIAEFVFAMRHGLGLNKILSTIHIYPTMMEANKYLAGQWKQNHKPEKVLGLLRRFHQWRLGA